MDASVTAKCRGDRKAANIVDNYDAGINSRFWNDKASICASVYHDPHRSRVVDYINLAYVRRDDRVDVRI